MAWLKHSRDVAVQLHDLLQLLAVYEQEYDLPAEVVTSIRDKIEHIAQAIA